MRDDLGFIDWLVEKLWNVKQTQPEQLVGEFDAFREFTGSQDEFKRELMRQWKIETMR